MEQKNHVFRQKSEFSIESKPFKPRNYRPKTEIFACLVRHGERADDLSLEEKIEFECNWDPPLTNFGKEQAAETGKHLRNFLQENNFELVVIESSPFLRSMQTAAGIAQSLGVKSIKVNYVYSEWLKLQFYPEGNPIGKLTIETLNA